MQNCCMKKTIKFVFCDCLCDICGMKRKTKQKKNKTEGKKRKKKKNGEKRRRNEELRIPNNNEGNKHTSNNLFIVYYIQFFTTLHSILISNFNFKINKTNQK